MCLEWKDNFKLSEKDADDQNDSKSNTKWSRWEHSEHSRHFSTSVGFDCHEVTLDVLLLIFHRRSRSALLRIILLNSIALVFVESGMFNRGSCLLHHQQNNIYSDDCQCQSEHSVVTGFSIDHATNWGCNQPEKTILVRSSSRRYAIFSHSKHHSNAQVLNALLNFVFLHGVSNHR